MRVLIRNWKALVVFVLLLCGAKFAEATEWHMHEYTDEMSGDTSKYIWVSSRDAVGGGKTLTLAYECGADSITYQISVYAEAGFSVDEIQRYETIGSQTEIQRSRLKFDTEPPININLRVWETNFVSPMLLTRDSYEDNPSDTPYLREMLKGMREELRTGKRLHWEGFVDKLESSEVMKIEVGFLNSRGKAIAEFDLRGFSSALQRCEG